MLNTYLTRELGLRYPIIGAPMAGAAGGRLAHALAQAGGIGVVGIASDTPLDIIEREAAIARGDDDAPFGLALMLWAVERRPELLTACLAQRPRLLSLSFGTPLPYIERVHDAGILVSTQVNAVATAQVAEDANVDLIVAQGTEAGGHTGSVGTLPLLQAVLEVVSTPVVAAGGIASARGVAAILAAGAHGAWCGTPFLSCPESNLSPEARRRLLAAGEGDTVLTHVFDRVQRLEWPEQFPGRALRNAFTDTWAGRDDELRTNTAEQGRYAAARAAGDHDTTVIYAGQGAALVNAERPAGEVLRALGEGAEVLLRRRSVELLDGPPA